MAGESGPSPSTTLTSEGRDDFQSIAESAGIKLKEKLSCNQDSVRKTYGFDLHEVHGYEDVLDRVVSHKELRERHSGGTLLPLGIFVATRTIKQHDQGKTSDVSVLENSRKVIWLLALFVDRDEKEKIGRSFSLNTRFNVVEGEIFLGFEIA